jgi:HAD superfamily hydrolase (TIGR01662 family)
MAKIQAVCFDVGETIINETKEYGTWADWLGVPRHTFSAVFGAVIARGEDYRQAFQHFQPGFDLTLERQKRADSGLPETFDANDLYPDAIACLQDLRTMGVTVALAGNQTARAEALLQSLNLPVDLIGTSDSWGVEKPSAAFFERIIQELSCGADQILYVGDRLDNDIKPAQAIGMVTVQIKRGPWGYICTDPTTEKQCLASIASLDELPKLVHQYNL